MSIAAALSRLNRSGVWRRRVRVGDDALRAPSLDRLVYLWLHRCGFMGAEEGRTLRRLVRPGAHVVDIGANVGLYTLLLSRLVGDEGRVFAYEPEPDLFAALRENCFANQVANVIPVNCALGEASGRVRFYRSVFNSGDNRLGGFGWAAEAVEVEMARLDDVLSDARVDFIKMDVQGYEMRVLTGMQRLLAANPHLEIYFEFWPHGLTAAGSEPEGLLRHLHDRGFRIYQPHGTDLVEAPGWDALRARLTGKKFTNLVASRTRAAGVGVRASA